MMSHCAKGARPVPSQGSVGIRAEYFQALLTSVFTYSL